MNMADVIQMEPMEAQKDVEELAEFIRHNRLFPPKNLKQWIDFNFPRPWSQRKGAAKVVRATLIWAILVFGTWFILKSRSFTFLASVLVVVFPATMPSVVVAFLGTVEALGSLLGNLIFCLIMWFVVLYNSSTSEPSLPAASAIVFICLLIYCYFISCLHAKVYGTGYTAFTASALATSFFLVQFAPDLIKLTTVYYEFLWVAVFVLIAMYLQAILAFIILPEASSDDVRFHMMKILEWEVKFLQQRFIIKDKTENHVTVDRKSIQSNQAAYNKILFEQAATQACVKGSVMDMGFLWDQPLHLAGIAKQLSRVTRHFGSMIHSLERGAIESYLAPKRPEVAELHQQMHASSLQVLEYAADQLSLIHDALIVRPGILGQYGWAAVNFVGPMVQTDNVIVGNNSPRNVVKASERNLMPLLEQAEARGLEVKAILDGQIGLVRSNWAGKIGALYEGMYERRDVDFFIDVAKETTYIYSTLGLLDDVLMLTRAVKNLYKARGTQRKFVLPFKGWPKQPKPSKPPKSKKPITCKSIFNDVLYAFYTHMMSPESHFAVRRVILALIVGVWAFVPATAAWFAANNGYWIYIASMVVTTPQTGATFARILIRISASLIALLWAVAGFYLSSGNYLVILLWMIPLVILDFYFYAFSKQTYMGMVIGLTYSIVALNGTDIPRDAWLRGAAQFLAVVLCFVACILIYPNLARIQARMVMGKVFFNVRQLYQRIMNAPLVEKSELVNTDSFKEGATLYQNTQNLLSQTRQTTLYLAAGEPDLDRPYDQAVMEAISASIQRLLEVLGTTMDASLVVRHHPDYINSWHMVKSCWDDESKRFERMVSITLDNLGNSLLQKSPVPPLAMDVKATVMEMLYVLDPKTAVERLKSMGYQATPEDGARIAFAGTMIWGGHISALIELQRAHALLAKMYGEAQWYYYERIENRQAEGVFPQIGNETGRSDNVEPDLKKD